MGASVLPTPQLLRLCPFLVALVLMQCPSWPHSLCLLLSVLSMCFSGLGSHCFPDCCPAREPRIHYSGALQGFSIAEKQNCSCFHGKKKSCNTIVSEPFVMCCCEKTSLNNSLDWSYAEILVVSSWDWLGYLMVVWVVWVRWFLWFGIELSCIPGFEWWPAGGGGGEVFLCCKKNVGQLTNDV